MQPQEFNAFVAAIVSARQACLMTPKRAEELIEDAARRAGFAMKNLPAEKAAVCDAIVASNAVVNGRRMSLSEARSLGYDNKEFYLCLQTSKSGATRWDPLDNYNPICIDDNWLSNKYEVIVPNV